MSKVNTNYKSKQNTTKDKDYYIELYKLLTPESIKIINGLKSDKIPDIIKINELYNYTYRSLDQKFSNKSKKVIRDTLAAKITVAEAKKLYIFIKSLGIKQDFVSFVNEDAINDKNNDSDIEYSKPDPQININNGKSRIEDNSKTNSTQKKKKPKLDKFDSLINKTIKNLKKNTEEPTNVHIGNINKINKRSKEIESPSFIPEKKPNFIEQLKQVKDKKININNFPFQEKDDISILNDKDTTNVHLKEIINDPASEIVMDSPEPIPSDVKLEVDKEIITKSEIKISEEKVYSYKDDWEKEAATKLKIQNKKNKK